MVEHPMWVQIKISSIKRRTKWIKQYHDLFVQNMREELEYERMQV
jgi:hypothetical protein